jgi:DNA polymerase-3 subunit beta
VTVIDPRTADETTPTTDSTDTADKIPPFEVTTDQGALVAGLKAVMPAVSARPAVPILSGVKLSAGLDGLTLTAFDYDVALTHQATGTGQGTVLVSARLLLDLVKDLAKGCSIRMYMDGARCVVEGDGVTYTLLSLPLWEYPSIPVVDVEASATLTPEALTGLVDVSTFASRDTTLPVLNSVRVRLTKGGNITAHATDRYRLGEYRYDTVVADDVQVLIARDTVALLPKVFGKVANVDLAWSSGSDTTWIQFRSGTTTMTLQSRQNMDFPKVEALLPEAPHTTVTMATADVAKAVKQVSKVLERNAPLHLSVRASEVHLSASYGQDATALKPIPAVVEGLQYQVGGFNPGFLTDVLKVVGGELIDVGFSQAFTGTSAEAPARITKPPVFSTSDRPGFRVILMPVRIAG